jgi:dTDP-4-dehydrorhamnose reductase
MNTPCVWITGAGGLIGSYLVREATLSAPGWRVCGLTRAELDLTDAPAVRARFLRDQPALVIHCAALSKTLACQQNPALARAVNVDATARLAELAADIPFIFLSTDLVFDGRQGHYAETDPVHPLTIYAQTKVASERMLLLNPRHTVVRTSLNYGTSPTGDRAFNEEFRKACQEGQTLTLFTDEFRCPLPAAVTARAIWALAACDRPGLYHLTGRERLSRWEIGQLLAAEDAEMQARLRPGSWRDYAGPTRAPDTSLNCAKIQGLLPFPLPAFSEWLRQEKQENTAKELAHDPPGVPDDQRLEKEGRGAGSVRSRGPGQS